MNDSPITRLVLDSSAMPTGAARNVWRSTQGQFFDFGPDDPEKEFHARFETWNLDGLILSKGGYSGDILNRTSRRVRGDGYDHYTFLLHYRGRWQAETNELQIANKAASVSIIDFARPISTRAENVETVSLTVPRDALARVLPSVNLHGLQLNGARGGLLFDFLTSLPRRVEGLTVADAPDVAKACAHLIAACVAPSRDATERAQPQVTEVLLRRAIRLIDANLANARWGVDQLAAAMGLSRSTLYRLFETSGGVAEAIRQRRLRRAHIALADVDDRRSLASLAETCGFSDQAVFSRAFSKAYGYSPRLVRQYAGPPNLTPAQTLTPGRPSDYLLWIRALRS